MTKETLTSKININCENTNQDPCTPRNYAQALSQTQNITPGQKTPPRQRTQNISKLNDTPKINTQTNKKETKPQNANKQKCTNPEHSPITWTLPTPIAHSRYPHPLYTHIIHPHPH